MMSAVNAKAIEIVERVVRGNEDIFVFNGRYIVENTNLARAPSRSRRAH
jgi:hypothetical protein